MILTVIISFSNLRSCTTWNDLRPLVTPVRNIFKVSFFLDTAHICLFVSLLSFFHFTLQQEPIVRIGIHQHIDDFVVSSAQPFLLEGVRTSSASFSLVMTLNGEEGIFARSDIRIRMAIETDSGMILVRLPSEKIRLTPSGAPLKLQGRKYRGNIEVFGNGKGTMTVVNELLLEDYLLGVVPNELAPDAFPEMEALKAQAVAARTYIVRNIGQSKDEGFDICATDFCQVYRGLDTEHPLATEAVQQTRGLIATYMGEPIRALYSSTCGGRTENVENVFREKLPYLVSTLCHYRHPEPREFSSNAHYSTWEEGLLGIADVQTFDDVGRFLGIADVGKPASLEPTVLATFIRSRFFSAIPVKSDLEFLKEQGILTTSGDDDLRDILLRLILKKNAFEWQSGRLMEWNGITLTVRIGSEIRELTLRPDVAIFSRTGDERIPVQRGAWVGGESMDLRISEDQIEALVYRSNLSSSSADRYSPLARWQTHRTRRELNNAIRPLKVGLLKDLRVLRRGPSERVVNAEVQGTNGTRVISGPRLRSIFGLRDSLVYIDAQRNAKRELLGMSFYGGGWGHGVGMCQVGAYGMAIDGALAEEILKTYYQGIELEKVY